MEFRFPGNEFSLVPEVSDNLGRLAVTINQPDTLWLDVVSLFPQKTYLNRPNGLRPDKMQMLEGLKPAFVRFPGGAIVGGLNLDNHIQWKNSIGNISQPKGTMNLWGYYTTN
jgi:alpha-L-arabinofuranosidase